ncbi:hypothetical protein B0O80DRAFT_459883 [Mortierella sp. GBAus27b]|nr:hypothetical protein BGX31_006796 [Mortierella sp. GBA43]KAI8349591.1 hypothetical protein B0O80DRAFT_459883 [Mortierella sp. GBAus27b]
MSVVTGQIVAPSGLAAARIGPDSRLTVSLLDVSLMDAPSKTLAEQVVFTSPNGSLELPIPFSLTYDPSNVRENFSYAVSARVVDLTLPEDSNLTWITTTRFSVLTHGEGSEGIVVEIEPIPK